MASDKEHYQPLNFSAADVGDQAQRSPPQPTAPQPVQTPHLAHVPQPQQPAQLPQAAQLHQGSHPAVVAPQQVAPMVVVQQPQYVNPQTVVIAAPAQPVIIENYKARQSKILGIIQLVAGGIALLLNVVGLAVQRGYYSGLYVVGTGIWCSVFIFLSGSFAICAGYNKRRSMISAHLGLAIVGSIFAFVMLCMSVASLAVDAINLDPYYYDYSYYNYDREAIKGYVAMSTLWMLSSLVVFIACVWSSSLGCRVICCSGGNQGVVQYTTTSGQVVVQPGTQVVQIPASGVQPIQGYTNQAMAPAPATMQYTYPQQQVVSPPPYI